MFIFRNLHKYIAPPLKKRLIFKQEYEITFYNKIERVGTFAKQITFVINKSYNKFECCNIKGFRSPFEKIDMFDDPTLGYTLSFNGNDEEIMESVNKILSYLKSYLKNNQISHISVDYKIFNKEYHLGHRNL